MLEKYFISTHLLIVCRETEVLKSWKPTMKSLLSIKNLQIFNLILHKGKLDVFNCFNTLRSTCWVPKRACDLMSVEVGKLFKLTNNSVVPVGFNVPRKVVITT